MPTRRSQPRSPLPRTILPRAKRPPKPIANKETTVPVSPAAVKELREMTGAGILDCKSALDEAGGDFDKAKDILRKKGVALAAKRAERTTAEGLVQTYVHHDGRLGALVEINCETDFVARTDDFSKLAQNIALQVAATNPTYVASEDIPKDTDGDAKELCLLLQPFVRDESMTVADMVKETIRKTGENIRIRRFARFELGR
ncbi:MAG: translation elongation factor Ts [Chloroflexi bacterium]|nr:translation elongation factor Ts [Chloroflexota bacterium]